MFSFIVSAFVYCNLCRVDGCCRKNMFMTVKYNYQNLADFSKLFLKMFCIYIVLWGRSQVSIK